MVVKVLNVRDVHGGPTLGPGFVPQVVAAHAAVFDGAQGKYVCTVAVSAESSASVKVPLGASNESFDAAVQGDLREDLRGAVARALGAKRVSSGK